MAQPPFRSTADLTAANVRAEVARAGYSAASVARALNWSQSRFARRLSGEVPFDVTELAQLSDHLGVPLAALLPAEPRRSA